MESTTITATSFSIINPHSKLQPAMNGTAFTITASAKPHLAPPVFAAEKASVRADKAKAALLATKRIPRGLPAPPSRPSPLPVATRAPVAANLDEVRVVGISEYAAVARTLAEAFAKDLVVRYVIDTPDRAHWSEAQKWQLHLNVLEYCVYGHILKGLVTTVGPNYDCVALWMPPGADMDDLLTQFRCGIWRLHYKLSGEGRKRFFNEFLPLLHDTKVSVMGERDPESWYLVYIGTRPGSQGKGFAKRSIQHVTRLADQRGQPCYLESSHPRNVGIYRKLGFEPRKKVYLQRAEMPVSMDIMVREAKETKEN